MGHLKYGIVFLTIRAPTMNDLSDGPNLHGYLAFEPYIPDPGLGLRLRHFPLAGSNPLSQLGDLH